MRVFKRLAIRMRRRRRTGDCSAGANTAAAGAAGERATRRSGSTPSRSRRRSPAGASRAARRPSTARLLQAAAPGTSALNVIQQLPGVNVQGADGLGMYEWSNRITMRGFQTQQIGQTMDGIPLGDMSYGNFNGLGIGRAVDPSNVTATQVTQGTGGLGTASANNLGRRGAVCVRGSERDAAALPPADGRRRRGAARRRCASTPASSRSARTAEPTRISRSRASTPTNGSRAASATRRSRASRVCSSASTGFSAAPASSGRTSSTPRRTCSSVRTSSRCFMTTRSGRRATTWICRFRSSTIRSARPASTFGPDFDYLSSWSQSKQLAELSTKNVQPAQRRRVLLLGAGRARGSSRIPQGRLCARRRGAPRAPAVHAPRSRRR